MRAWNWTVAMFCLIVLLSLAWGNQAPRVRKLHPKHDEIAEVRTALGVATLIQVPDRPTSVVLGDTNAFKVEYLENAITIKPLTRSSRSNLYIYTDGRRFNVSLNTVPLGSADYIVYLEPEVIIPMGGPEHWRDYPIEKVTRDFTVHLHRIGKAGELLQVDFTVTAHHPTPFKPEWVWLTGAGKTVPIQELYLSGVELTENKSIDGHLAIRSIDAPKLGPLQLEIRAAETARIRLPQVTSWMK